MSEPSEKDESATGQTQIIDSNEIQKGELDTLKGDSVGESLYSGKWILSTLLSLSKLHQKDGWNERMENDLCTLWDMTADKEVARYLVEHDFLKIAEFSLKSSEEPRLVEIMVGIIGNLTCEPEVLEKLTGEKELVEMILRLLSTEDTETLMQVMRLLHSTLWCIQTNSESKWKRILKESRIPGVTLPFILRSSTNQDLLISTVNLLRASCEMAQPAEAENILLEGIETPLILPDLVDAMEEVLSQEEDMYSVNIVNFIEDWLELVSSIIGQTDSLEEKTLNGTIGIMRRILVDFQEPWNLLPLDEVKASCIHRCTEVILRFRWRSNLQEDIVPEADRAVITIMHKLKSAIKSEESDVKDTMQELLKYLEGYWTEIAKAVAAEDITKTLASMDREHIQFSLDILRTKIPEDKLDILMKALP